MARKLNVRTPLIDEVYAVLFEKKSTTEALESLLNRDLRAEDED